MNTNTSATQMTEAGAANFSMKGLTYLAMPLGAIRLGHTITLPGDIVQPVRDDEFKITRHEREADGTWLNDPLNDSLRAALPAAEGESVAHRKLRAIPVRVHVNDPSLIVQSRLEAFDRTTHRSVCSSSGDGKALRWSGSNGFAETQCVGCERCPFANTGDVDCKFFGRIALQIEGQSDELGTYVLRSTSINSMRTFESKLWQMWSAFGGKLRGVPLTLKMRTAQTALSNWESFQFVDLELRDMKLAEAAKAAKKQAEQDAADGLDVHAMEATMRAGLRNNRFVMDAAEDGVDLGEFIDAGRFAMTAQAFANAGAQSSVPAGPSATVSTAATGTATFLHLAAATSGQLVEGDASNLGGISLPDFAPATLAVAKVEGSAAGTDDLNVEVAPVVEVAPIASAAVASSATVATVGPVVGPVVKRTFTVRNGAPGRGAATTH